MIAMEATSCSILNAIRFTTSSSLINNKYSIITQLHHRNNNSSIYLSPSFSPSSSFFPRNYNFPGKCSQVCKFTALCSPSSSSNQNPSQEELAVILEVDGVLMDAYRLGNRQAFNAAFRKLSLDCANWSEPVYTDLLRKSTGDEERMLILFFNRIGWPTSLPTSEKGAFVKSVLREKKIALDELMSNSLPLRPGVDGFIDDACNEEIPVVIVTAYSKCGDKISRSIIDKLGHGRVSKLKVVGNEEVEQSLYGQLVKGIPSGLDEQLFKEAMKAASAEKQRIAEEVASRLKLIVDLDTTSSDSLEKIIAALRGGAEYVGVPVQNCVLIAGTKSGVAAAERIGMPCVVMRSSLTSRAEFPSAIAITESFGGADLTISKLLNKLRP
jgi:beta-phosphoglucomutase-like phosphatase (HAD superfamily)